MEYKKLCSFFLLSTLWAAWQMAAFADTATIRLSSHYSLVTPLFNSSDNTLETQLVGLPENTVAYKFNAALNEYEASVLFGAADARGWYPNLPLPPGEGVFVVLPPDAEIPHELIFSGLPLSQPVSGASGISLPVGGQLAIIGPQNFGPGAGPKLLTRELGLYPQEMDTVYQWNSAANNWDAAIFSGGAWYPEPRLKRGESVFLQRNVNTEAVWTAPEAPNFEITDVNGRTYVLRDLLAQGKTVLIDFWKTSCVPCIWEWTETFGVLPSVYKDKGLVVIGLAVDNSDAQIKAFANSYRLRYDLSPEQGGIILAGISSGSAIRSDYGVGATLPVSVVVNRGGKVVSYAVRYRGYNFHQTSLLPFLAP